MLCNKTSGAFFCLTSGFDIFFSCSGPLGILGSDGKQNTA